MTEYIVEINGNKIERKEITCETFGELNLNAGSMEFRRLEQASELIDQYHWHRARDELWEGLEALPQLFEVEVMQKFLLLLGTKTYRRPYEPIIGLNPLEKYKKALFQFLYYRQAGIPIYDGTDFSCVALASEDANISPYTLIKEILEKIDAEDQSLLSKPFIEGYRIRILSAGKKIESIEEFRRLEQLRDNLSREDQTDMFSHYLAWMQGGITRAESQYKKTERIRKKYKLKHKPYKLVPHEPCGKCENCISQNIK